MKAAKVSIKFERYCFQLNPSALKCTINNGTVVRNQNITFVIYAGCLTTLYGKRLTVPRFVRLLPLVPSAADAETYITRKNNAQILNIQVTGELGSENAAAWSLWFHPRKLFVALKNGAKQARQKNSPAGVVSTVLILFLKILSSVK